MLADTHQSRLAHQIELEKLFSKNQLIPRIRQEFLSCEEIDFPAWLQEADIPQSFGLDLLTQMTLHRRATLPTLVGILRHHFETSKNPSQETADMLLKAVEAGLVDWSAVLREFVVCFTLSKDVEEELNKFQYPLPMVIKPRTLHCNRDSAYLMSAGSVILKNNHHEDDVCLDHLNRVNAIKFSIDHDTATMVRNRWKDLDKPKIGETRNDFEKRKRAFEKYDRSAHKVIALLLQEGNEFYLTHKYDKRGRTYCQGYHVNYQGAPWNKAVVQLADKEIVK